MKRKIMLSLAASILILGFLLVVTWALPGAGRPAWFLVNSGGGQLEGDGLAGRSVIGQPVAGSVSHGLILCSGVLCGPSTRADAGALALYLPLLLRHRSPPSP